MVKVEDQVLEKVMEAPSFKDKTTLEHIVKDIADIHIEQLVGNMRLQVRLSSNYQARLPQPTSKMFSDKFLRASKAAALGRNRGP